MKLLLKRYFRPKRHYRRRWLPVSVLRRMLGDRVYAIGIQLPVVPAMHETGIGILKPIGEPVNDDGGCAARPGDGVYLCEREGEHEVCSAFVGTDEAVTWPREAVVAVTE
jgi:hypothetical protein